jgi:hypothetical protein
MKADKIKLIILILVLIVFDAPDIMTSIFGFFKYPGEYLIAVKVILTSILLILNFKSIQKLIETFPSKKLTYVNCYLIIFLFFLIYSIVPTVISGSLFSYSQIFTRFLIAISIALYIKEHGFLSITNYLTYILSFFLFSYLVAYLIIVLQNKVSSIILIQELNNMKIFGRLTPTLFVEGIPFIQFRSIFGEPANASGVYGAFSFILLYKYAVFGKNKYLWLSGVFLFAVNCTFSFAGYIAAFFSFFIAGVLIIKKQDSDRFIRNWLLWLMVIFFTLSIMRPILIYFHKTSFPQKWVVVEMVFGAHKILDETKLDKIGVDVTDGRARLANEAVAHALLRPLGIGIQNIIANPRYDLGVTNISSSAPFFWLQLTGFIGLGILLLRELVILHAMKNLNQIGIIFLLAAFVDKFISELNYGIWMSTIYFLMVLIFLSEKDKDGNRTLEPSVKNSSI